MRSKICAFFVGALLFLSLINVAFAADTFQIDPVHSRIGFSAQHMMVSKTQGEFTDYTGTIQFDQADPTVFQAEATIKADSISTRNENRDNHLKSADFFDVTKFPTITFKSKKLDTQPNGYVLVGDLTIKDVTKEISIPVNIAGPLPSMSGGKVIGISGETTINRQDYGIVWNKNLDAGGMAVSNDIKISLEIEAGSK